MLNYSCALQNPTKDLLRCRYGGWRWYLVWRLHNYWHPIPRPPHTDADVSVFRCACCRMPGCGKPKTNSLCLSIWSCSDIVKVVISCWPLILFTMQRYIHYSKQCRNPAPPNQAARNKAMSCFALITAVGSNSDRLKKPASLSELDKG